MKSAEQIKEEIIYINAYIGKLRDTQKDFKKTEPEYRSITTDLISLNSRLCAFKWVLDE